LNLGARKIENVNQLNSKYNNTGYCVPLQFALGFHIWLKYVLHSRPGSSVGIVTVYGLDSLGIESRRGRDFPHLSRPALGPTQPPVQWVPGLSQGKEQLGRDADPSPPSTTMVKKEQSYTCTPPMGCTACAQPQCLYKGAL